MPVVLVDPRDETPRPRLRAAPRLETLEGGAIALLDISKPGGKLFLDRVEQLLRERFASIRIVRESKMTFARPAPGDLLDGIVRGGARAVVEGLADWGSCTTCSLHDAIRFEQLGIPAVTVATDEFRTAARAQAAALGRPDYDPIYVPHPIQDQARSEIEARADAAFGEIVARLVRH